MPSLRLYGLWLEGIGFAVSGKVRITMAMELHCDADWVGADLGRPLSLSLPRRSKG